jgi:hypothetical protein
MGLYFLLLIYPICGPRLARVCLSIAYRYIDTGCSIYIPLVTFLILNVLNFTPFICLKWQQFRIIHDDKNVTMQWVYMHSSVDQEGNADVAAMFESGRSLHLPAVYPSALRSLVSILTFPAQQSVEE